MTAVDGIWRLRQIGLFDSLPATTLQRLAAKAQEIDCARGGFVYRVGEPSDGVYVIRRGRVKLTRCAHDGRELVLGVLEPGDIFGESGVYGSVRSANAQAYENTGVYRLTVGDFADLMAHHPEFASRVFSGLVGRLEEARGRLADVVFCTIAGRLAGLLLRLADCHGRPNGAGTLLDYRITHQEIANRIGSTRETVTATLNQFRRSGLIAVNGRQLIIADADSLQELYVGNHLT